MSAHLVANPVTPPRDVLMRAARRYPLTFWLIAAAIIANGAIASALHGVTIPLLSLFLPCITIIMTLCQVATCVLLTVIFVKSRRWELQPLVVLFLATALLDTAAFLTVRLPGREVSLIAPGNTATPWLLVLVHVTLSICAVPYAAARSMRLPMSAAEIRRAMRVWFPAWTVLTIVIIVAIVSATTQHTPYVVGERTTGTERLIVFGFEFLLSGTALVLFLGYIERATPNWIDLSIVLTMIAGLTGLAINVRLEPRDSAPWATAQFLYLWSATFVLIAAIHDLVDRLGDSLRTESRALQTRVAVAEQNAEIETSILKSRFVAMVSHELRTPLASIVGMAELLEREGLSDRQMGFMKAISTSANGLHRIVSDLLDFSQAESGRIELEDEVFDLEQAVDDIVVLFREQAHQRGVALSAYVDPVVPRSIRGDQTRLKQVLQNLISNAIRFTSAGNIRIEVLSGSDTGDDGMVRFFVSDTGIGIAPHALGRIFDPFVQEDASTARKFGGTGLGLTIVKHIVELMGGQIEVWSTVDVGTTFLFTLPTRTVQAGVTEIRAMRDVSILVFDENPELLLLLMRFMDGWRMNAVGASTTSGARTAFAKGTENGRRFDLVLVGSGVSASAAESLLFEIRAAANGSAVSAVLLRDRDEAATSNVATAFDLCIAGPLRQSALFDAIVRLRAKRSAAIMPAIQGVPGRAARSERILIAEDNAVNQALLVAQLEHLGFTADVVTDGTAAIEAVERAPYDLIFMDCQMPEMDGFEATRRIRASSGRAVPIVALTAHVLPGYRETCLAAGMNDYLAKPALIGPLSEMVDRWIPALDLREPLADPAPSMPMDTNDALVPMRARLLEIFHGDTSQADRIIATSVRELKDGTAKLVAAVAGRDISDATNTVHRLKGIALEIGAEDIAERARELERDVQAHDWARAEHQLRAFIASIETATPAESNV